MARVYVSVGSNVDRDANVRGGIAALRSHYGPLMLSSVYQSRAVGFAGEDFYNLVVGFDTNEPVDQVFSALRELENCFGRRRGEAKFSPRTLDLDILIYDELILQSETLVLPREEITENAHVLQPLAEIALGEVHPLLGVSYQQLWQDFELGEQQLWVVPFAWQ